jgi:hypothetical protein
VCRTVVFIITAVVLAAYSQPAWSRGPSGGASGAHMSGQGFQNSNGPMGADRDKGLARAEDRRSRNGSIHEKATTHKHKKHKKWW